MKDVKIINGSNIKDTVKRLVNDGWKITGFSTIDNGAKNAFSRDLYYSCILIKEDINEDARI